MANHDAEQHQRHEQVVIQRHRSNFEVTDHQLLAQVEPEKVQRIDLVDTFGSVGDVDWRIQVVHEYANNFTKAQGHDGQIVTTQAQGRSTQQHAKQPGQAGTCRNNHPQR